MLFFSLIVTFTPSSTAALLSVEIDVILTYDAQAASEKILPLSGETAFEISISAKSRAC